jgi:Fe-S cluster assembly protein SufD
MSSSTLIERIAEEHAAAEESLPSAVVARARRRRAIATLVAKGLPTTRDENWRYANLRPLERARFVPVSAPSEWPVEELPRAIPGYSRYVFVDGVLAPALSASALPSSAVIVQSLGSPLERRDSTAERPAPLNEPAAQVEQPAEGAFGLLNEAFALDGADIRVGASEPGAVAATPACIELVFVAHRPATEGASYPRVRVDAAPHARLRLIERHWSLPADASFAIGAVDVSIGSGARVDHYRIQQLGSRAVWLDTLEARVARSGTYGLHGFALGAQSARSTLHVELNGEGAELHQHAVALGDRQQVLDSYTVVEHAAAHTRTAQSFRGIAAGRSRVAFNGKIIVRRAARGTDSNQSLRGLLAGPEAEIDVRPQLEIYTDDVRCSHGATAGKLDEDMLFYLLSRGLAPQMAQRLLKWAFLEDVVSKVDVPVLRRQIEENLVAQMQDSQALQELL